MTGAQLATCHGKSGVHTVSTTVGTNGIALAAMLGSGNNRTALLGVRIAPVHGNWLGIKLIRVSGQGDVVQLSDLRVSDLCNKSTKFNQNRNSENHQQQTNKPLVLFLDGEWAMINTTG
jgi:hypothetical protein